METFKLNCCTENGIEQIIEFLNKLEIKATNSNKVPDHVFDRWVKFEVSGVEYAIEWYHNQCTLLIGEKGIGARLPFKYMYLDTSFPLSSGNRSLGFSQEIYLKESISDREFPYGVLRIPLINFKR